MTCPRCKGTNLHRNAVQFKNLMVWYGAERIARELTEGAEEEED